MRMTGMYAIVLGCVATVGVTAAGAQGSDQDKQFIATAAQGDLTEITLSKLALTKTSNPQVRSYAQKMITDHTKMEAQMKPFASQMGVPPPTALNAEHQQALDQLQGLSGASFDKQYVMDMDTDHHATLDVFKTELSTTQDARSKPMVAKGEKVVAEHTMMADKLSKKLGGTSSGM